MKAVFLDRDGIINKERNDYTWLIDQFEFTDGLFEALRFFQENGFELIVITNQGGIDKGIYSHKDVEKLHSWMKDQLLAEQIRLSDIYYCPHHSDFQKCLCRKPGSLMIEKAIAQYDIDPPASLMLGDKPRDVEAAERAGVRGVLMDVNPKWPEIDLNKLIAT